jgi:predicted HNH restriction endonuclease
MTGKVRMREERRRLRIRAIKKLGGKCCRCGFSDYRALQFDHVNGGGTQEYIEKKHYRAAYTLSELWDIGENKDGKFQLLCANCNFIKRAENQEGCNDDYNSHLLKAMSENKNAQSQGSFIAALGGDPFVVGVSGGKDVRSLAS